MTKLPIYYAIIALNKSQVGDVIQILRTENRHDLASWLDDNKDSIYGDFARDWKPFKDKKLTELIEETNCYCSKTHKIKDLDIRCSNLDDISEVRVFFIDIFSLYIEKYRNLATRADLDYSKYKNCCFLINYELSSKDQEYLEKKIENTWPNLYRGHNDGFLHRISARLNDVKNFKNYIYRTVENKDNADPRSNNAAEDFYGYGGTGKPSV